MQRDTISGMSHGQLITTEHEQDLRWTTHFSNVLNRPDPEHPPDIQPVSHDITVNLKPHNKQEILKAISPLRNNKAQGKDELPAELFKVDPLSTASILEPLFADIWEKYNAFNPKQRILQNYHNATTRNRREMPTDRASRI